MDWKEKKVFVIGTGISGIAATDLLVQVGAEVTLYDGNNELQEEEIRKKLKFSENVNIVIGTCPDEVKKQNDYVVVSPGVPIDNPLVEEFRGLGKKILGEIELAYTIAKGKIAAITGTNGKTTTTALVGEILRTYYQSVFVVGNIGIPYTGAALDISEDAVVAAEISSFQLETVDKFCPKVSAILNITPDHLNRHYTMENYSNTKFQITKNQTKNEICVLNYEDSILREKAVSIPARVFYFSSEHIMEKLV